MMILFKSKHSKHSNGQKFHLLAPKTSGNAIVDNPEDTSLEISSQSYMPSKLEAQKLLNVYELQVNVKIWNY